MKKILLPIFILLGLLCRINYIYAEDNSSQASQLDISISSDRYSDLSSLLDDDYNTHLVFNETNTLTITSDSFQGLYIVWDNIPSQYTISYNEKEFTCGTNGFLHEYIPIEENTTSCKITFSSTSSICDIYAYSKGVLPSNVQLWSKPNNQTDILVFSTHADDEILFLGGVLAQYAGQEHLNVSVCYMTTYWSGAKIREHEKLDGLWEIGVKNYPINSTFDDLYAKDLQDAMNVYSYDEVEAFVTEQIRHYKPLICVTQDLNGEYGHGGHMLLAKAVCAACDNSADANFNPESAKLYGIYDVPKTYLHLYNENTIKLNLRVPLSNMDNLTAIDVATNAYKKHVSQQWCWFYVSDTYEYSCADFGLYRSLVGTDTNNDMLENITTYEQQRINEELASKNSETSFAENATEEYDLQNVSNGYDNSVDNYFSTASSRLILMLIIIIVIIALFIIILVLFLRKQKR